MSENARSRPCVARRGAALAGAFCAGVLALTPVVTGAGDTAPAADRSPPPPFDVQGHRGCRGLLPENSIPAFRKALELGVTTLEMDIQTTRDRVLVVFHDQHLDPKRCVHDDGRPVRERAFKDLDYAELAEIDCGSNPDRRFDTQQPAPGARIPRLDDVLALARDAEYPVRVSIEIKMQKRAHGVPVAEVATLLVDAIRAHRLEDRAIVQSFDPEALREVARLAPSVRRAVLTRASGDYARLLRDSAGSTILSPKFTSLSADAVRQLQADGVEVIPWTVNRPADIRRMISWGVDGLITDYPDRALAILGEADDKDRER